MRANGPARSAPASRTLSWPLVTLLAMPALAGTAVAAVLLASGDTRSLRLVVPLSSLAVVVGVLVTLVVAGVALARHRFRTATAAAHDAGRRLEHEAHRRFLSRLDHELKNPVTAIRAAAASLPSAPSGAERTRLTGVVDTQTARLASLVGDLRKLGNIETQEIEQELVDLALVVTDAVEDLSAQVEAAGAPRAISLALPSVPWPLPRVRGDMDLLYLAVSNLLSNAAKFSPPGSPIEVRGAEHGGFVEIEVADAGMGVPREEIDSVFDELSRGVEARGIAGSGIGLALVRTIARRHGGDVSLRSLHRSGTVVRLSLPVAVGH